MKLNKFKSDYHLNIIFQLEKYFHESIYIYI